MIRFREKNFLLAIFLLTIICFLLSTVIEWQRASIETELNKHGFDRAFVISVKIKKAGIMSASDSSRLMANPPRFSDGALAVLSRNSATALQAMPEVESMMAIVKADQKLTVGKSFASEVSIFHIPASFVTTFALGDPNLLNNGTYVASSTLRAQLPQAGAGINAMIGITDAIAKLISSGEGTVRDMSPYRMPIVLSGEAFQLPGGSQSFDSTLFALGEPPKLSIPEGIMLFNKVWLVVKLKDGVDAGAAADRLGRFVEGATDLYGEKNLTMVPMEQFFSKQLSVAYLSAWQERLNRGVFVISILLLLMFVLTRHARVRREVALRSAMGANAFQACWFSSRHTAMAIMGGILAASMVSISICLAIKPAMFMSLLPMVAVVFAVGVISNFLVFGSTLVASRGDLMAQLKGTW